MLSEAFHWKFSAAWDLDIHTTLAINVMSYPLTDKLIQLILEFEKRGVAKYKNSSIDSEKASSER